MTAGSVPFASEVVPMKKVKDERIMTTLRIPREFWGKVRAQAFEEKLTTGDLVIKALAEYLTKRGGK
jgi:predicted DNA-binding ribbon-helix-helix protein